MLPYSFTGITLMQIEIFLQCARHNNFTKAADALHITPSMVSKRISSLENTIGITLFAREKNHVVLTPSGHELYKDLQRFMTSFTEAVAHAKRVQNKDNTPIVFDIFNATNTDRYFIPLLSAFESTKSHVSFQINMRNAKEIISDLEAGSSDIAFAPKFMEETIRKHDNFDFFLAVSSPLYAGVSEANPLAQKEVLTMEDLKDISFILPNPFTEKCYNEWILSLCAEHGFSPRIDLYMDTGIGAHLNISDNNLLITDKYYRDFHTNFVVFKEIKNTESGLLMFWNKSLRPITARFIEHAKRFYKELR